MSCLGAKSRQQVAAPEIEKVYRIKAIPTEYKGITFRSRLEARWAVFFDALGLDYQYETTTIGVYVSALSGTTRYSPDFWLPQLDCWIEIKPPLDSNDEQESDILDHEYQKVLQLVMETRKKAYLFFSEIGVLDDRTEGAYVIFPNLAGNSYQRWCECPKCGQLGITYKGIVNQLDCKCFDEKGRAIYGDKSPRLLKAYAYAQRYAFRK